MQQEKSFNINGQTLKPILSKTLAWERLHPKHHLIPIIHMKKKKNKTHSKINVKAISKDGQRMNLPISLKKKKGTKLLHFVLPTKEVLLFFRST